MKRILTAALIALTASALKAEYKITLNVPEDLDGAMVYLTIGENVTLDSTTVVDRKAEFSGEIEQEQFATVKADGRTIASFILENDTIDAEVIREAIEGGVRTTWDVKGGKFITRYNEISRGLYALREQYYTATEAEKAEINNKYKELYKEALKENENNIIGAILSIWNKTDKEFFTEHPKLAEIEIVKDYLAKLAVTEKLRPGNPFQDFTVSYNGESHSLSDVVGKGDYVLLDFWASWCGPCIQSILHLKDIHKKYEGCNFRILGVPINDEAENTLSAQEQIAIPWEIWVGEGNHEASAAYGIDAIPHIVLFSPDGTILLNKPQEKELDSKLSEIFGY